MGKKLLNFCLAVFLSVGFSAFAELQAQSKNKIIISPVRGQTQYPGVIKGIRYVLISDLTKKDEVEIVPERELAGLFREGMTVDLKEISKRVFAHVMIRLDLLEDGDEFTMWVRAFDLSNGFNIGSESIRADYNSLKTFQNQLTEIVHRFLFLPLSTKQLVDFSEGHSDNRAAIQKYGFGYEKYEQGNLSDAAWEFDSALKIDSKFELAGQYRLNASNLAISREKDPTKVASAMELIGNNDKALTGYAESLRKNPNDIGAIIGQGRLLVKLGKVSEGVKKLESARNIAPGNADLRIELARGYLKLNERAKALNELKKARELGSRNFELHDNMAGIYFSMGDRTKAKDENRFPPQRSWKRN